ncbi:MAG: hypothetical protein VB046_02275 [Paludibacter sp.]|nr:hypothetical protein [Paludibacter sp.]
MEAKPRLKLTLMQRITHYSMIFLWIIPTIASFVFIVKDYLGTYSGQSDVKSWPFIFFLCILIFLYILQYRRLYFKKIEITFTESQFQDAIKRTINELEWDIVKNNKKMFQATRNDLISAIMGELITIVKCDGYILINSICDPNKWTNILPFRNNENIRVFLKNLREVVSSIPEVPRVQIVENELSFKRMLFRIIIYPICLIMILVGILMIYYHITLRNALAGVGLIALAIVILYADIKLFFNYKKKKYEKKRNTKA